MIQQQFLQGIVCAIAQDLGGVSGCSVPSHTPEGTRISMSSAYRMLQTDNQFFTQILTFK